MGKNDMKAFVINLDNRSDRLYEFQKNNLPFEVERFSAIRTNPGWTGCTTSHFSIIRNQTRLPFIIFEDDFIMLQPWHIVEKAISQLPPEWDALWLGATLMKPVKRYSENLFILKEGLCAYGIIYRSWRIIDYILSNFENYFKTSDARKTIDVFYAYDVQEKFNCFVVSPLVAIQSSGYSDIENQDVNYTQISELFNIHAIC